MDWSERIGAAERRGFFAGMDRLDVAGWRSCAIGELPESIERQSDGVPFDGPLISLGAEFADAVYCDDFERARKARAAIQERAAILIAERYAGGAL